MEKFIDLGVDDNHSAFGEGMQGRQLKFKSHLEKMNFTFTTNILDLPKGDNENEELLHPEKEMLEEIATTDSTMGADLDQIFSYLTTHAKADLGSGSVVVDHKWDPQAKCFTN